MEEYAFATYDGRDVFSSSLAAGLRRTPSRLDLLAARAKQELAGSHSNSPLRNVLVDSPSDRILRRPLLREGDTEVSFNGQSLAERPVGRDVWHGSLMEELAERPLAAQARGGMLVSRATERGGHWGSLRTSWLVKNSFEGWRSSSSKRAPNSALMELDAERQRLMDQQSRHVEHLERQLQRKEMKVDVDINAIVGAVLDGLQTAGPLEDMRLQLQKTHSQVLLLVDQLSSLRSAPNPGAGLELSELRRLVRQVEEMRADNGGEQRVWDLKASVEGAVERCCQDVRVNTEALGRLEQKLHHSEMTTNRNLRLQPDFSPVVAAMEESSGRLVEALEDTRRREKNSVLDAISSLDFKVDNSEVLTAIRRIRLDDSQIVDAIQNLHSSMGFSDVLQRAAPNHLPLEGILKVNHRQLIDVLEKMQTESKRNRSEFVPLEGMLTANHRQLLEAIQKPEQWSELQRTLRNLQGQTDMATALQRSLDRNHRSVVDELKATRTEICNALESLDFNVDHSEVLNAISGGHDRHAKMLTRLDHSPLLDALGNIEKHVGGLSAIHANMETHHQGVFEALRGLGEDASMRHETLRGLGENVDSGVDEEFHETKHGLLVEHIAQRNRDVLAAVAASKAEHMQVLHDMRQLIAEGSRDTVKDIVAVIETAVDHSPLLEAIGSFELKGHSEVLSALKQLRLDFHMEPDFTPILRALNELPSTADFSELLLGIQSIQSRFAPPTVDRGSTDRQSQSVSPTSRQKFIVTLGAQPVVSPLQ